MYSNNSGGRLERFLEGKGFYIVLFLCAAVVGMSVWAMNAGTETVYEETLPVDFTEDEMIETIIITPPEEIVPIISEPEDIEPAEESELTYALYPEGATSAEVAAVYLWPVSGEIERAYTVETLAYDDTLGDWRTHAAIDIESGNGDNVIACRSGTVERVYNDSLLGTVMVIDHGNGIRSVYGNLDEGSTAAVGTWVSAGTPVAKTGTTAICESSQKPHLHFAMLRDGHFENPMNYLVG